MSSLGKKTQFSALFEDIFLGNVLKGEGGGTTLKSLPFFANFVRKEGRGAPITDKIRKVVFDIAPKGSHCSKNTGILWVYRMSYLLFRNSKYLKISGEI